MIWTTEHRVHEKNDNFTLIGLSSQNQCLSHTIELKTPHTNQTFYQETQHKKGNLRQWDHISQDTSITLFK